MFGVGSLGLLGTQQSGGGGGAADPDAAIKALFASGEQGVWYDSSDFSTMFQDSAGTTPVTAVGQSVGRINDKSGRGNHALQATAAARPVLRQDGAGKYYLEFDGVDDILSSSAFDLTGTQVVSGFFGAYISNSALGFAYEFGPNSNSNVGTFNAYYNDAGDGGLVGRTNVGAVSGSVSVPVTIPNKSVYSVKHDGSILTPCVSVRRNGASYAGSGNNQVFPANFSTQALNVGSRVGSFSLAGNIYSLIIRGAASTPTEITDTETWVNGKTGAY